MEVVVEGTVALVAQQQKVRGLMQVEQILRPRRMDLRSKPLLRALKSHLLFCLLMPDTPP
ncbi:MAG: hypothetical protein EBQ89_09155 [Alphaproteobacteria bacterium]|nr:hypothetical protein [Alphaproteobacteria bacterium]